MKHVLFSHFPIIVYSRIVFFVLFCAPPGSNDRMCLDIRNYLLIFTATNNVCFDDLYVRGRRKKINDVKIRLARNVRADVGFPIVIF